jgi:tRNA modification GTPase
VQATDTIVALSTPPGRSGIGVIRLSGEDSLELLRSITRDENFSPEPNRVILKAIFDPDDGSELDQALVTYFKSPRSYTGEDVVELSCHGSPPLLLRVIDVLLALGARAADAGEFTARAFANRRINLTQAEAVRDLIDAQTLAAARQARRQVGGELSFRLRPIEDKLLSIIVILESAIEFVEDDLPADLTNNIRDQLTEIIAQFEKLTDTFRSGRLLREGIKVCLVGRPNVGKSSVFNGLLVRERAIVTSTPGTTRDTIDELININGVPVLLTDTAGMRDSFDEIEQMGIERTRQASMDADLVLVVLDGSCYSLEEDQQIINQVEAGRYLIVLNKKDLGESDLGHNLHSNECLGIIRVSAKTGEGLNDLCNAIIQPFQSVAANETDLLITNARHYHLLRRAASSLDTSSELLDRNCHEEIVVAGLHEALSLLGQITGETTSEEILTQIFSTFCIGK